MTKRLSRGALVVMVALGLQPVSLLLCQLECPRPGIRPQVSAESAGRLPPPCLHQATSTVPGTLSAGDAGMVASNSHHCDHVSDGAVLRTTVAKIREGFSGACAIVPARALAEVWPSEVRMAAATNHGPPGDRSAFSRVLRL